jgi:hypothetical protein
MVFLWAAKLRKNESNAKEKREFFILHCRVQSKFAVADSKVLAMQATLGVERRKVEGNTKGKLAF